MYVTQGAVNVDHQTKECKWDLGAVKGGKVLTLKGPVTFPAHLLKKTANSNESPESFLKSLPPTSVFAHLQTMDHSLSGIKIESIGVTNTKYRAFKAARTIFQTSKMEFRTKMGY
eukprot:TRINITY_DN1833_c0_g1_i1.p1 TRINITY_DN1833_c0_g1~~TRINITY_DN1833_c0_g1_i1.p1  ORF type:complete len:115 (+),score=18.29 TRINITY_DN1833_c0_g1_i1:167-511(+)